jgi:ribonucleoside-diphosphate reductase alpha chain
VNTTKPTEAFVILRRNGETDSFQREKIVSALTRAYVATLGSDIASAESNREQINKITDIAINRLIQNNPSFGTLRIEDIQDQVELALMRHGNEVVARAYVIYRDQHKKARVESIEAQQEALQTINVVTSAGETHQLDLKSVLATITMACSNEPDVVSADAVFEEFKKTIYDGMPQSEINRACLMAARSFFERDPAYSRVTARLLLNAIRAEVLGKEVSDFQINAEYENQFVSLITKALKPNYCRLNWLNLTWKN